MASVNKREWTYKGERKSAWVVRYTDHDGKRRMKTFERKKEADAYRLKAETEIEAGTHIAQTEKLTVAQVCELYLRHSEQRLRQGSIGQGQSRNIAGRIDKRIVPYFGKAKLFADLEWRDIEAWHDWLLKEGLAAETRRGIAGLFQRIEAFAFKRRMTTRRPVADARKEIGNGRDATIRTFTSDQVAALLAAVTVRPPNYKRRSSLMLQCMVNLAAFGGLRFGEILGLTLRSLDLERRMLRIRHSLTPFDELKGPKTRAGLRDVPIPQHVVDMLGEWLGAYHVENERELVFRTQKGGRLEPANFHTSNWRPLLVRAGLVQTGETDWFHFHALRHFCASWLIANGMALPEVAVFLGHSKFDMTLQVYAHPIVGGSRRHDIVDTMAGRLIPAGARAQQELLTP